MEKKILKGILLEAKQTSIFQKTAPISEKKTHTT
jgi:hypothetical protein